MRRQFVHGVTSNPIAVHLLQSSHEIHHEELELENQVVPARNVRTANVTFEESIDRTGEDQKVQKLTF